MSRVTHFEIPSKNPEQLAKFYQAVLGWKIEKWPGEFEYWMITTGDKSEPGINGGISNRESAGKDRGITLVAEVEDADAAVEKAKANGGTVTVEPDDLPGVGRLAYFLDPEGNEIGVIKSVPEEVM